MRALFSWLLLLTLSLSLPLHSSVPPQRLLCHLGSGLLTLVCRYLNTVEEGGETVFPNIPAPGGDNGPSFSECARRHLAAKPVKGSAVLFHSIKPSGELERRSLHTACPVIRGEKFAAPKWLHVGHYAMGGETPVPVQQHPQKVGGPLGCRDDDESCEQWAANGEQQLQQSVGRRGRWGVACRQTMVCLRVR